MLQPSFFFFVQFAIFFYLSTLPLIKPNAERVFPGRNPPTHMKCVLVFHLRRKGAQKESWRKAKDKDVHLSHGFAGQVWEEHKNNMPGITLKFSFF